MASMRAPALLLLVLPALIIATNVHFAVAWKEGWILLTSASVVAASVAASVGLLRRKRWAYTLALVTSIGLAALHAAVGITLTVTEGWQTWSATPLVYDLRYALAPAAGALAGWHLLRRRPDFARDATPPRTLGRLTLAALGVELALIGVIAVVGLGSIQPYWYQRALIVTQVPAMHLLRALRLCCGFDSALVFSDALDLHWGGLRPVAIPILVVANTFGLLVLALLIRRLRRRRHLAPAASPSVT